MHMQVRQEQYYNTRLLGRFAPIFYLNCEHILFVYILKQKQNKTFADFIIFFRAFSKYCKNKNFKAQILEDLIFHKLFLGSHMRSHTKFGSNRFSRFDVYWIQTISHPDKQIYYTDYVPLVNPAYQEWKQDNPLSSRQLSCSHAC